jgi:glutamyl-Q tRNA(Asp) synthetase
MQDVHYRGRFAPSPTGALHLGSLLTAVASFLDARSQGGRWLVRMEDLDPPREVAGAADNILRTLERFGLHWDEAVVFQSRRDDLYQQHLQRLVELGLIYPCGCSRRDIRAQVGPGASAAIYPGTCRGGLPEGRSARALRVLVSDISIGFDDRLQGTLQEHLPTQVGDFILRRADGPFAYQLAVVVDDALQGISDVVRGADLLDSTARQVYLQRLLEFDTPRYLHLPVLVNERGAKLSKQTGARAVASAAAVPTLVEVLDMLGQRLPESPTDASLEELWAWATAAWDPRRIPRTRCIRER